MNAATLPRPPSGQRRLLGLIVLLFGLPFGLAALLYTIGWRPAGSGNHGTLLTSQQALSPDGVVILNNPSAAKPLFSGQWLLLVSTTDSCAQTCQDRLDEVRRVHVALNKNIARVKRVLLTDAPADPNLAAIARQLPDMAVIQPRTTEWRALLPAAGSQRVVLIDPQGQPVLHYAMPLDAKGLFKDMDKLLKFSWLG